jgi:hypothetical protein
MNATEAKLLDFLIANGLTLLASAPEQLPF